MPADPGINNPSQGSWLRQRITVGSVGGSARPHLEHRRACCCTTGRRSGRIAGSMTTHWRTVVLWPRPHRWVTFLKVDLSNADTVSHGTSAPFLC